MKKIRDILSNNYGIGILVALVWFAAWVVAHFAIYHSLPISSLWKAPATSFSFYHVRLIMAFYLVYLLLVLIERIKVFKSRIAFSRILPNVVVPMDFERCVWRY